MSLDEQLLFQSGKWDVNKNGEAALRNLSDILAQHSDLNILVEGHTDNIPYGGSGNITDNWDLSVKRATAVVKILLQNSSVDPANITAAGRSQYCPVDSENTAAARQKNRRTEIIRSETCFSYAERSKYYSGQALINTSRKGEALTYSSRHPERNVVKRRIS